MFGKLAILIFSLLLLAQSALAVSDPRSVPNDKFGINVIVPSAQMGDAASLVNTNGDWGYIVITLTKDERNVDTVQQILNQANEKHMIPIIRLATNFDASGGNWEKPGEHDATEWANFLSQLYFPTANKYIEVYNEVNTSAEWGGDVDPAGYAKELAKTTDALKAKSDDFFILNAPLDLSLPTTYNSLEASSYFEQMQASVPGIFDKIDGLASHSYPNPGFSAPPSELGRFGIDGYSWELSQISNYTTKDLPVFITETGWKRSFSLGEDQISDYYREAFETVWSDPRIVAVAPFVLSYPQMPFAAFSFAKDNNSDYYSYFGTIKDLPKVKGQPRREDAIAIELAQNSSILERIGGFADLKIKNIGNYILSPAKDLKIKVSGDEIFLEHINFDKDRMYPGEETNIRLDIKNISSKDVTAKIQISDANKTLAVKEITIYNQNLINFLSASTKTLSASFKL